MGAPAGQGFLPMAVRIRWGGMAHLIHAHTEGDPSPYATLCGLPVSHAAIKARGQARGLALCAACDAEDLRLVPNRASRIMR